MSITWNGIELCDKGLWVGGSFYLILSLEGGLSKKLNVQKMLIALFQGKWRALPINTRVYPSL